MNKSPNSHVDKAAEARRLKISQTNPKDTKSQDYIQSAFKNETQNHKAWGEGTLSGVLWETNSGTHLAIYTRRNKAQVKLMRAGNSITVEGKRTGSGK